MNVDDKALKESFSAWLDNESDDLDMQRLVNYVNADSTSQADSALNKQSRVKSVLQGWGDSDISGAVHQEISTVSQLSQTSSTLNSWYDVKSNPWSLAASVVLIIAISVPVMQQGDWFQDQLIAHAVEQHETVMQTKKLANSQTRLNKYLQKHLKQASLINGHVSLPYQSVPQLGS